MNLHKPLITAGLILIILFQVHSQDNFIRIDLVSPVASRKFGLGYERSNVPGRSIIFNIDFNRYMHDEQLENNQPFWEKNLTGYSIFPEYRFYPFSNSFNQRPQGLFYGVYTRFMNLFYMQDYDIEHEKIGYKDIKEHAYIYGLGATFGYKYRKMDGRFYFETLVGAGWGYSTLKNFHLDSFPDESLLWRYELSVGYCF